MSKEFNPIQFGARIKRLRVKREMSILKLAEKSGVNKNTICSIEKGEQITNIDVIYKLASALEITVTELLDGKPVEKVDYIIKRGFVEGKRKERVDVASSPTHRIGNIDVNLEGGNLLAGIIEVFADGKKEMACHGGEELFFCLTGKILVNINGEKISLSKGDCVVFWASEPHNYISIRDDNKDKISVGLSVISDSKYESLFDLYNNLN